MSILLFISCIGITTNKGSDIIFQLPQKEIFVKTSKLAGARFIVYFAPDSLSLENSKDFIEFSTGYCIRIIVDTTKIYVDTNKYTTNGTILNIGKNHFNIIEVISDSIFNSFFDGELQKYPYTFIHIDAKEYDIGVNGQTVKQGNLFGW